MTGTGLTHGISDEGKIFCGTEQAGNKWFTQNLNDIDCPECIKSMNYGGPSEQTPDSINPEYYKHLPNGIECIQVTKWFNFNLGNAIKYCWRAGKKSPNPVQDLQKAIRYLEFELERLKEIG